MVTYHLIYGLIYYTINTVMRYHVIYKKGIEKPFYGTIWNDLPRHINDPNTLLKIITKSDNDSDYKNILTWQLNDLPLTRKFISAYGQVASHSAQFERWGGTKNQNNERPPGYNWGIGREVWWLYRMRLDIYKSNCVEDFLASRKKMNELIDYLDIDPSLKLNEKEIFDGRIDNLNKLHYIFEQELPKVQERHGRKELSFREMEPIKNAWEAVNYIVHMNEKTQDTPKDILTTNQLNELLQEYFVYQTTLAFQYIPPGAEINDFREWHMQDHDYKHFTTERNGQDLLLDFGTVGKDLYSCSSTNDIELAKEKRLLSQQITYNPWVAYNFETVDKQESLDKYNKWIKDNNINYTEAKFTPGRHILSSELISHPNIKDPVTFYNNIIKRTPIIEGFVITDDNNKSIL